jgi:hypothetical protein
MKWSAESSGRGAGGGRRLIICVIASLTQSKWHFVTFDIFISRSCTWCTYEEASATRHKLERLHLVGSTRDEKNSKILAIGILILTVLPDIPTTTAKAATTNLGMSFGSPLAIFLFDFLIWCHQHHQKLQRSHTSTCRFIFVHFPYSCPTFSYHCHICSIIASTCSNK